MTEAEYQAAVAANPPQPEVSDDDNKIIRHTVTYSADGSYRTPNANFVNTAINGSWAQRFWYEAFGQDLVRAFPFMEGAPSLSTVVSQFISATSPAPTSARTCDVPWFDRCSHRWAPHQRVCHGAQGCARS